ITVPDGFHVSLFATEPDVQNPISICTDTQGRLWVAENYTYSEREVNYDLTLNDRIVIFEDADGDGRHDSRKVFWDRGKKLTSVAVGLGGVWVTCAPQLLFIPDRDGDDVPDSEPEVILDGFDSDSIRHNIVNGLKWGPDGWLYGRHGIQATSKVGVPGAADSERVSLNCCVWRYHPTRKTFEVVTEGTTNPWGMDWDEHGECWLINTVIGHLWHVVPGAYWKRMYGSHFNPHLYELIDQTADHIHWNSTEAWSDVRKEFSATTDAAGGGHAHCGLIYCDATWPQEYRHSLLAGNLHGRRLNRDVLEREGCGYVAHHAPDFLNSSDPYFRVIEMDHARDGGIYIADWSDIGECHENDGVHRSSGRIYKLTWDGLAKWQHEGRDAPGVAADQGKENWQTVPEATHARDLAQLPATQLVALQRHPSEWYARTARRVLQERALANVDLSEAATALEWMIDADESRVMTLRALWGLDVIGQLSFERLKSLAYFNPDEYVRATAVKLLVAHPQCGQRADEIAFMLGSFAHGDKSGLVRLAIASALQRMEPQGRLSIARELAKHAEDASDHQQPLMIWYGIESTVPANPQAALTIAAETPMLQLARFIARRLTHDLQSRPEAAAELVQRLSTLSDQQNDRRTALLQGMSAAVEGWRRATPPAGWDAAAQALAASSDPDVVRLARELSVVFGDGRAVEELRQIVGDGKADAATRRAALRSLVEARADNLEPLLKELISNRDFSAECIHGLSVLGGRQAPQLIANRYSGLRLEAKEVAIAAFVSRPDFAPVLLAAVAEGKIPRSDVPPFQLRQMLTYGSDALATQIRELWPELQQLSESKQRRIQELSAQLTPETIAHGDPSHGRALFSAACAKCHKLFGEGGATAPELTGAQRTNLAYLLENIVDPSATISKNFKMSVVLLDDGRVLNGVVTNPTDRTITLQTPAEPVVIDRESIEEIRETELSLMPEGQLDRLTPDEVRDLIAYLMSPTQVELPADAPAAGD
ncbi:MAG: c-type cytochrome, partial [Planctomycetaceae bacterium]|nr:c-type cytochrome [Planctomycetaceae bacterium]